MNVAGLTAETIELAKSALAKAGTTTGFTVASGLQVYDLEAPAKSLYPVLTPLRNRIPRVPGMGGAVAWKAITGINVANARPGLAEGARGSVIQYTTVDKNVSYKTVGLESSVSDEAEWDGRNYQDMRALSSLALLQAMMIEEEKLILGGHAAASSVGVATLGTTPTPTLSASGTGGTLPGAPTTYAVRCVALNLRGYMAANQSTLTLLTGTGSGHAKRSAQATQAVTLGEKLFMSVTPVNGAVAYAWFVGVSGGDVELEAITTINSHVISAPLTGTGQDIGTAALDSDESADSLVYDGIISQLLLSGSGAYVKTMATGTAGTGTPLTSDSAGGIVEIDDALKSLYDNARVSPDEIYMSSQEIRDVTKKVIAGGGTPIVTINQTDTGIASLQAGGRVGTYLNKYTQQVIPIVLHPYLPAGMMLGIGRTLPFPNANVPNPWQMRVEKEYHEQEFARIARSLEHGVFAREALQCYFPAGNFVIRNIAAAA